MKQSNEILWDLQLPEAEVEQATLAVKDLNKELLVLRLAFGKLKATVYNAFAPLAAIITRVASQAVWAATRIVKVFGQVISGLFGITGAGKIVEKTIKKVGKSAQRSLASFDQLNRLQKTPSAGGVITTETVKPVDTKISDAAQRIIDKIHAILAPLKDIDFSYLEWAFFRLQESFEALMETVGRLLGELWQSHLAPFLKWVIEKLLPVLLYLCNRVLAFLDESLSQAGEGFLQMLADIKPVTDFMQQVLLTVIDQVGRALLRMRTSMQEDGFMLRTLFETIGREVRQLWDTIAPTMREIQTQLITTFRSVSDKAFTSAQTMIRAVTEAVQVVGKLLTGDWDQAWDGMSKVCKTAVNGIIGALNALLIGLTGALNSVVTLFNKMHIKVPDWVPGMGGKEFGFNLKTVKAPQIPYLAKGAVLPANQPFLAMVGDQKHGTNVEAPLATIQEAVALVLQDQVEAMMAGFEALLQENRQLRRTVEGIELGDGVIGQAANRYNQHLAVLQGGAL